MNKSSDRIDRLRIASPCPVGWGQMTGDDRVRHCDLCSLHVYNIAEMSRTDAERLIATTEGRICARLFRREDGTVITKDCPVGLRAIRRRIARVAGAAFATVLSLCGAIAGQKQNDKDRACQQQVKITRKADNAPAGDTVVTGLVQDPMGAAISGATISVRNKKTGKSLDIESNAEGRFTSPNVAAGNYDIIMKAAGFKNLEVKDLTFVAKENLSIEVVLTLDGAMVTVGILAYEPMFDEGHHGITVIMSGEKIRRLPIP